MPLSSEVPVSIPSGGAAPRRPPAERPSRSAGGTSASKSLGQQDVCSGLGLCAVPAGQVHSRGDL